MVAVPPKSDRFVCKRSGLPRSIFLVLKRYFTPHVAGTFQDAQFFVKERPMTRSLVLRVCLAGLALSLVALAASLGDPRTTGDAYAAAQTHRVMLPVVQNN